MLYVWLWLIAQLLLLLPNRWTVSIHCRDGSTLPAHENACVYFAFPASFFRPFKVYTNFTEEVYSYFYTVNSSSSVPKPWPRCDTSLCKPRADQYSRLPCVAARTLPAGGGTRNTLLQRRSRSAICCHSFSAGLDVASGIKCKYNCAQT